DDHVREELGRVLDHPRQLRHAGARLPDLRRHEQRQLAAQPARGEHRFVVGGAGADGEARDRRPADVGVDVGGGGVGDVDERQPELHADGGHADVARRGQKPDDAPPGLLDPARDGHAVGAHGGGGRLVELDAERLERDVVEQHGGSIAPALRHRRCARRDRLGAMPRRAEVAVTLAAAACALAATTIGRRADAKVTWQGTGLATAGWTDNILNAPDQTTVGAAPRESDVFFQLAPGALMTQAAPRILERLGYVFTADLFARHSEANSYTNALTWFADVATSPTTRLTLSLDTTQGRLSTFALNQSSADATVGVLTQNNSTNYFKQGATQGLVATPLPEWRFAESLAFGAFIPIDRGRMPDGYTLTAELGADRTFRTNAFGLVLRESFIDFVQPRDPLTDVPLDFDSQQLLTTALARWRRDWSASWNTVAE